MGSKLTSVPLLVNLVLIVLTAAPAVYIATGTHYYFLVYLVPLLVIEILAVMRQFNTAHKSISYFFEAIENDETSLRFPVDGKNKTLRKIHENLNRVNRTIQEIKTKQIASENFYLNLARHSATGLIALNPMGQVIVMNQKAYEYAGMAPVLPMDLLKNKNETLYTLITGLEAGRTVLEKFKSGDAFVFLSIRVAEVKMEDGYYKLISLQDIKQELDEQELDSWIKLIRILSHEIMNSIAPITSLTDTLKKGYLKNNRVIRPQEISEKIVANTVEGLEIIEDRGKGLLEFVNNFRKLTQVPQPKLRPVSLRDWIKTILTLLNEKLSENNILLETSCDPDISTLMMDESLMTQVMINIVNNAVHALELKTEDRKIRIGISQNDSGRTVLRISNNGEPIPADVAERIFIPFFTTRESGSGIGLSLSRQIVRLHRGTLRVESDNEWTTFVITL